MASDEPTATIDSGLIAGKTVAFESAFVHQFLGVPFAAPPVRFEPPQRRAPWQGVYNASAYKPSCIQKFDYPEVARSLSIKWFYTPPPPVGESEDCLYLNVYAPAGAVMGSRSKAVMFWIYGGGFNFGSGAQPLYDGSGFAANQDVIVVTFNYRVNVFGFPGSPQIPTSRQNLGFVQVPLLDG
jgi:carboxylesterase type B